MVIKSSQWTFHEVTFTELYVPRLHLTDYSAYYVPLLHGRLLIVVMNLIYREIVLKDLDQFCHLTSPSMKLPHPDS